MTSENVASSELSGLRRLFRRKSGRPVDRRAGGPGPGRGGTGTRSSVYTAPTEEAARDRFAEFADAWGRKYPAIVKLWENAWGSSPPFSALRHRDPPHRLHHQCDRVGQRPHLREPRIRRPPSLFSARTPRCRAGQGWRDAPLLHLELRQAAGRLSSPARTRPVRRPPSAPARQPRRHRGPDTSPPTR